MECSSSSFSAAIWASCSAVGSCSAILTHTTHTGVGRRGVTAATSSAAQSSPRTAPPWLHRPLSLVPFAGCSRVPRGHLPAKGLQPWGLPQRDTSGAQPTEAQARGRRNSASVLFSHQLEQVNAPCHGGNTPLHRTSRAGLSLGKWSPGQTSWVLLSTAPQLRTGLCPPAPAPAIRSSQSSIRPTHSVPGTSEQ